MSQNRPSLPYWLAGKKQLVFDSCDMGRILKRVLEILARVRKIIIILQLFVGRPPVSELSAVGYLRESIYQWRWYLHRKVSESVQ